MIFQKYVPYNISKNEEMGEAENVPNYFFKDDVGLKGYDHGGKNVLYGAGSLNF